MQRRKSTSRQLSALPDVDLLSTPARFKLPENGAKPAMHEELMISDVTDEEDGRSNIRFQLAAQKDH